MSEKFKPDYTPFSKPLTQEPYSHKVKAIEGVDEKVLRIEYADPDAHTPDEMIEQFKKAESVFNRLQKEYGIHVINMDMVLGQDTAGDKKMYMLVDKIEGENVEKVESVPIEEKNKFDAFYSGLLSYIRDSFKTNDANFFSDIKPDQFVYGHKVGETNERDEIYLVDTEPQLHDLNTLSPEEKEELLQKYKEYMLQCIAKTEKSFSTVVSLEKARLIANSMLNKDEQNRE